MNPHLAGAAAVPIIYFALLLLEKKWPSPRRYPEIRNWQGTGIAFMMMITALSASMPFVLRLHWVFNHHLIDGTGLGTIGGIVCGYVIFCLFEFVYHWAMHRSRFLWLYIHQFHHSPQRLDMASTVFDSPVDMIVRGTLLVITPTLVLGVTPTAAGLIPAFAVGINMFQHCNIRTPRWLGYIIQRPEAHGLHHARYRDLKGKMWNYADLPIIDMIFGTFRNPETFDGEVGFEGSYSMTTLMRGVDVTLGERESAQLMDRLCGTNMTPQQGTPPTASSEC